MQASVSTASAGRRGWFSPDLAQDEGWIYHFTQAELDEIDAALRILRSHNCSVQDMSREDFPLPALALKLEAFLDEICNGRGFVVLRGLPVQNYSDEDAGAIFYGLGVYLGDALLQNPKGDMLGHVYDQGRKYGEMDVRGSQTNGYIPFHTDGCEIVGLLCLRPAKAGGLSSISSAVSVYQEIARTHPEYLEPLLRGYHYIRREAALSDSPVSPHRIPVFYIEDDVISCRFVPTQIKAAYVRMNTPLEGLEHQALEKMLELTAREPFRLDMDLQQGDIQLVNNYTVLHSRTEYEDWPEPERKRHMLRLWLSFRDPWPLPANVLRQRGYELGNPVEIHLQ
jgi:hypothetical protein